MDNNYCIFILEQPYVSNLLLQTLQETKYPVVENEESKNISGLNLINTAMAKEMLKNSANKIYSNSENSIDYIIKNFNDSNLADYIELCKNKYLMREKLSEIYPKFFFKKIHVDELETIDITNFPNSFIIKPTIGFLSMGVHKVNSKHEWKNILAKIKSEINNFSKAFPNSVLNSSEFLAEEIIDGEEYAIDAYFNKDNKAVIMNIFKHPFVSADDVSDRAYITSKEIITNNLSVFEKILNEIGCILGFKNFPIHIEVIKKADGAVIPIEINPMRFAGWCTTDLAYFAYGINMYKCFVDNKEPDWNTILKNKNDELYYFAMAETPQNIDKSKIKFDYDKFKRQFSEILEFRQIDFINKPVFAIVFGQAKNYDEIIKILRLNMKDYII